MFAMPRLVTLLAGLLVLLPLALFVLSGCNTVRGIGQDIKKGGEAIERAGNK